MKRIFLFLALAAMPLVSCNKDNGGNEDVKPLEATFTTETNLEALTYGEPIDFVGTATSSEKLDEAITLVAAKKSGETYQVVGEAQKGKFDAGKATAQFFADSKEMTDIKVTLTSGNKAKDFYFPVGKVEGELKGRAYTNDAVKLMTDNIVKTHQNSPEEYPEENTGAGSDTKSFFSMHGVEIAGKVEHILSLNQLRPLDGKNASFVFANVMGNTSNATDYGKKLPSQAGYAFFSIDNMSGGTQNRQCDTYEVGGHSILKGCEKEFTMKYVRGSWAGEHYHPEVFEFVDKLFIQIENADTPLKEMKAFWQLSQIQKTLDSATLPDLSETEEPTNLGGAKYVRKLVNAGNTTKAIEEVLRAGDYIVFRSVRGTKEAPAYYYGILQVLQFPDDKVAFANPENVTDYVSTTERIDPAKAMELNMKPAYFNIKCQCEVPAK